MKFFRWSFAAARNTTKEDAPAARVVRRRIEITVEQKWVSMQMPAQAPEQLPMVAGEMVQEATGQEPHLPEQPLSIAEREETEEAINRTTHRIEDQT
jgi:hypothetical protein